VRATLLARSLPRAEHFVSIYSRARGTRSAHCSADIRRLGSSVGCRVPFVVKTVRRLNPYLPRNYASMTIPTRSFTAFRTFTKTDVPGRVFIVSSPCLSFVTPLRLIVFNYNYYFIKRFRKNKKYQTYLRGRRENAIPTVSSASYPHGAIGNKTRVSLTPRLLNILKARVRLFDDHSVWRSLQRPVQIYTYIHRRRLSGPDTRFEVNAIFGKNGGKIGRRKKTSVLLINNTTIVRAKRFIRPRNRKSRNVKSFCGYLKTIKRREMLLRVPAASKCFRTRFLIFDSCLYQKNRGWPAAKCCGSESTVIIFSFTLIIYYNF